MAHEIQTRHIGLIAVAAGMIAAVIYLVMIKVTLADIQQISGHIPFDMRPMGYTPDDAATLLNALGAEGRRYYVTRQIPLDTFYPALLAITLGGTFCWLGRRGRQDAWIRIGIVLSIASALFDYLENLAIVWMILDWPEIGITIVRSASAATVAKSIITSVTVLILVLIGLRHWWGSRHFKATADTR